MKTFALLAAVALTAKYVEAAIEHGTELEDQVIEGLQSLNMHEKFVTFEAILGKPALHDELEDKCHGAHHLCSHNGEPVMHGSGHHMRAKTNQPIFGVLTQPIPDEWQGHFSSEYQSFFEASHADFLQAGGARIVPVDYQLTERELKKELANLNGIYIPGDTKQSFEDEQYVQKVREILLWASGHNLDESKHFPVVGVSWGMLSMLKAQTSQMSLFQGLQSKLVGEPLQQNLHLLPRETFIYDEMNGWDLEKTLDDITFFHELDEGVSLKDFATAQQFRHFVPVATYHQGKSSGSTSSEIVSTIEGTYFPLFGFSYRLDKVQFGFHASGGEAHENLDHSRAAIEHAQHIGNVIVDEARLSSNRFEYTNDETDKLLHTSHDVHMVTLPLPHDYYDTNKEYSSEYRTELYLFSKLEPIIEEFK